MRSLLFLPLVSLSLLLAPPAIAESGDPDDQSGHRASMDGGDPGPEQHDGEAYDAGSGRDEDPDEEGSSTQSTSGETDR